MAFCLLASVGTAVAFTLTATPQYSATARMFISSTQGDPSEVLQGAQFTAVRITSYADLIGTRELAQSVADDLGLDINPDNLSAAVTATVVPDTFIVEITATDPEPEFAKLLSQTFAEHFAEMILTIEATNIQGQKPVKATVVEAATAPSNAVTPQPVRNIALGTLIGLVIALCAAVIRELLDSTIRAEADLTKATKAPLLGVIPFDPTTQVRDFNSSLDLRTPGMEAYRVVRTNLQFVEVDAREKVFVVTSAVPGEGKTTTAVNLGIAHAQSGQRVLLIEADLRRPRASRALGLDESVGLTTVLIGRVDVADAIQKHGGGNLHVLASGAIPPNPAELLQSMAMRDLLIQLRPQYDVIIVDAPPLLPVTDAAVLAAQADGALLVVKHGRTRRDQVATAASRLTQVDASPIGIVLNMAPSKRRGGGTYGYAYGYGRRYGYGPTESPKPEAAVGSPRPGRLRRRKKADPA